MIDEDLYALLATVAPTAPATAPDGTTVPYCVYTRVLSTPQNVLEQPPGLWHIQFEVNVYASSYADARALAGTVKDALFGAAFGGYVTGDRDLWDGVVKLYRVAIQFEVFAAA